MFSGKHVLIVGGTKGIGYGLVEALSENGSKVTFTGRSKPEVVPTNAEFIQSDVSTLKNAWELGAEGLKGMDFDTAILCVGIITKSSIVRNSEGVEEVRFFSIQ
jgi:NAD(P)-dependent dehydrogenase (short-subunit alcohol dehydrogenase family)